LTADLDTEWAKDTSLVDRVPDPEAACLTWLAVRQALLENGYVQTTLTNFERAEVASTPRRFAYERASFEPFRVDAVGFGPGGLSTFAARDGGRVVKWQNEATSETYVARLAEHGSAAARDFVYSGVDRWLLHLTRGLAKLSIEGPGFDALLGMGPHASFRERLGVLEDAGLIRKGERSLSLTPRGMFFADAVTGFLAEERVRELRPGQERKQVHDHMG
jgi:coproporphyrinogen III oxidase-like Fe-S oxidoreductase